MTMSAIQESELHRLQTGPTHRFSDWPNLTVPKVAAGVYTIWDGSRFIYVGMAGRGMTTAEVDAPDEPVKAKGLRSRLNSHAGGRRSGDQFCVYVCDRFVVPELTSDDQNRLAAGTLLLDILTRDYIRSRLSYRFLPTSDGRQALTMEREIQRGALPAGKPFLNPL